MRVQDEDEVLRYCCELFGKNNGRLLYRAMKRITTLGFEVSPTDASDKVMIIDGSTSRKRLFDLKGNCLEYIAIGSSEYHLPDEVTPEKIRRYLK